MDECVMVILFVCVLVLLLRVTCELGFFLLDFFESLRVLYCNV